MISGAVDESETEGPMHTYVYAWKLGRVKKGDIVIEKKRCQGERKGAC